MQSPGRGRSRTSPMVPARPFRLGTVASGVTPLGLNRLSIMAEALLFQAVRVAGSTRVPADGVRQGPWLHFRFAATPPTPLGNGDSQRTGVSP